jgi:hypothetical protein
MDIDRDQLVEMLISLGRHEEATRVQETLPGTVDTAEHAELLERLGIAPAELVGSLDVLGGLDQPEEGAGSDGAGSDDTGSGSTRPDTAAPAVSDPAAPRT